MTHHSTSKQAKRVYEVYQSHGQSYAHRFARDLDFNFRYCKGCDSETPVSSDNICLLCGQHTPDIRIDPEELSELLFTDQDVQCGICTEEEKEKRNYLIYRITKNLQQ